MFDWVYIQKLPERDIKTLNVSLYEGFQSYNFFGYFFMIGAAFFLLIALFKIRILFPYIGIIALFCVGFFMYNKAKNAYQRRYNCFLNGDAITATVVKHSKAFNPFYSSQNHVIVLKYQNQFIEVKHKSEKLWEEFPINSEVIGLTYNNQFVFGPEMTVNFKFFKNE